MDTSLDHLDPRFRNKAFELLARMAEQRIPVLVVNTLRTAAEQVDAIKRGVSWVDHSKHEDGLAIDLVPLASFILHETSKVDWNPNDPVWLTMGTIGERLGLVWGGRWTKRDLGHFEQG